MQTRTRVVALGFGVLFALIAASSPAAAAPKRITGKLSKPGYTVIALAANGKATSTRAKRGRFRLRPPARRVTLHLRAPNGIYAGPIVVRRKGKRAILGVRAGARLGGVKVRKGYALKRLPKRWLDPRRTARARHGIPIGARRFGRVRSKPPRTRLQVPGDLDSDGIPDPLDIDDDGDLILDNLDRPGKARASQLEQGRLDVNSSLGGSLYDTVNANATALTTAELDANLSKRGFLKLTFVLGDLAELDCRGLVYCSSGGTGRVVRPSDQMISDSPPFPDCCDPDRDGLGTLQPFGNHPNTMILHHGATTAQIGTGDVLIERVTSGGAETQFPDTVQYVFATTPALVSYDDGRGSSATISYPFNSKPQPNELPVTAGPNGDVIVTLKFWRPQRRTIPPETGEWIDIGRLNYGVGVVGTDFGCPKRAFSENDPDLNRVAFPTPPGQELGGLVDLAGDRPASPANTFTYTLNLTECARSVGMSFPAGATRTFGFGGSQPNGGGDAGQGISFHRQ